MSKKEEQAVAELQRQDHQEWEHRQDELKEQAAEHQRQLQEAGVNFEVRAERHEAECQRQAEQQQEERRRREERQRPFI